MQSAILPDLWGEGQLLAFSGLDGMTSWAEPFVMSTARQPGDLVVRLPTELRVEFSGMGTLRWTAILGDCMQGLVDRQGPYAGAFIDHHTWVGVVPGGATVRIGGAMLDAAPRRVAQVEAAEMLAWQRGETWGLALRTAQDGALPLALSETEFLAAFGRRCRLVESVAVLEGMPPAHVRLLRKAISVMKVNVYSATGTIHRRWSTPDRWPHRHLWLWDSAFHAVGMAYVDLALAQDEILAMLEAIRDDGMLPHMVQADGGCSQITQPPVLAWAVLHVLEQGGDLHWARQCAPLLQRYLDWDRCHRDRNGNHLPEWHIEGNPRCRCGESGLDNSSVYDRAVLLDAPDFAAFLFNDYQCLAEIANRLGDAVLAEHCLSAAAPIAWAVESELWQEREGLYFHRDHEGSFVPVKTVAGFMPLFAGIPTAGRAARLAKHLCDPTTFGAPAQVPSEALDSGTFCKDMWRGPAWANLSYLIILGLRRYGLCAEAEALKDNLLATVQHWYEREGCLFEYYDALDITSPRDLDRKQRLVTGKGLAPIADYHWTAAVTAALLLE